MRSALRSPLATLVQLLLLVPVTAVTGACSSGTDVEDGGPTVTATGPDESTSAPTDEPTDAETDEPTSTPSDLPAAVAAVCAPYAIMVRAIKNTGFSGADPDDVAAELAPVMKEFAARVPDLERPRGMPPGAWRGIEALAVRILALPNRPTYAEIEAVERDFSEQERDDVDAAADWLRTNCPV
ncbi:hypothetical protein SFC88_01890 [Nocardioides sp. HM23]|uniref:hypothetical protein n=1 Tax=Nocardioides bizhenqiangii TaxID=3095076 RepID=UPI002AC9F71D|nr:hypothetical protein [Nocardioides sp. HM23]MDZ5619557.1 hypothetical protein [Nocardioides sp. HM23]